MMGGGKHVARHFVVDCPSVPGSGAFNFMNLLQRRVDNAYRAVTAAVFLSHGMRQDTAISLVLPHPACEPQRGNNARGGGRGQQARPQGPSVVAAAARSVTVTWTASELVGVWPDEKSIATRLQKALCHHFGAPCPQAGDKRTAAPPSDGVKGVSVHADETAADDGTAAENRRGFLGAVARATAAAGTAPTIVLLDENGSPRSELDAAASAWAGEAATPTGFVFCLGGPDGLPPATAGALVAMPRALTIRLPGPSLHAGPVVTLAHHALDSALDATGSAVTTAPAGALATAAARAAASAGASAAQPVSKKHRTDPAARSSLPPTVQQRVEAMYRRYRPAKQHKAAAKLAEFAGDEGTLLAELTKLWGPEPVPE